jgi:hypothetical protein
VIRRSVENVPLSVPKRAATASSPIAREKFAHMAEVWLHLAVQLEEQWALLDQWSVRAATGETDE